MNLEIIICEDNEFCIELFDERKSNLPIKHTAYKFLCSIKTID